MTLSELKTGQTAVIKDIQDQSVALQALRMGIAPGAIVTCVAKVPAGPTVIQHGGMELAIGQELSQQIEVDFS